MTKIPPSDVTTKVYLSKYLQVCANRRNEISIELSKAQEEIIETKQRLTSKIAEINELADVCIEESIEYQKEIAIKDSLTERLITDAMFKVIKMEDRDTLKIAIEYFNALRKYENCKLKIKNIDKITKMFKYNAKDYREILYNYYSCAFAKCLIEGYAYKFNNNFGYIMFKTTGDGNIKRLDWAKTAANKKKLIELGYTIKTKDTPDGIDHRIYLRSKDHTEIYFDSNLFENTDFCFAPIRPFGKSMINARETYKNVKTPQEIFNIKDTNINFRAKQCLCAEKFPGLILKYNRGTTQRYKMYIKNKIIKVKYRNEQ